MKNITPRAYTPEEVQEKLLRHFKMLCKYWSSEPSVFENNKTEQERMEGLIHSVLATIDGASLPLPAFDIIPSPHEADKAFHISEGENWFDKKVINHCQLHEIWGSKYCKK